MSHSLRIFKISRVAPMRKSLSHSIHPRCTVLTTYCKPQQHPARDAHDTFFLSSPASALNDPPADYLERVRNIHQNGGFDSKGYGYEWSKDESMKNVLRTHTTAVSAKMLYKLAQQKEFTPTKYFRFLL